MTTPQTPTEVAVISSPLLERVSVDGSIYEGEVVCKFFGYRPSKETLIMACTEMAMKGAKIEYPDRRSNVKLTHGGKQEGDQQ